MPRPTSRDELAPAQRHAAVVAILALHAAAGWGLLQVDAVRSAVAEAAPLFVDLIAPPAGVATVRELIAWLSERGEEYAYAFENPKVIRTAIDRKHVQPGTPITGASEIAFFPPMTGG